MISKDTSSNDFQNCKEQVTECLELHNLLWKQKFPDQNYTDGKLPTLTNHSNLQAGKPVQTNSTSNSRQIFCKISHWYLKKLNLDGWKLLVNFVITFTQRKVFRNRPYSRIIRIIDVSTKTFSEFLDSSTSCLFAQKSVL